MNARTTREREAEIRETYESLYSSEPAFFDPNDVCGMARELLAELDAERAEHEKTRARVRELEEQIADMNDRGREAAEQMDAWEGGDDG